MYPSMIYIFYFLSMTAVYNSSIPCKNQYIEFWFSRRMDILNLMQYIIILNEDLF